VIRVSTLDSTGFTTHVPVAFFAPNENFWTLISVKFLKCVNKSGNDSRNAQNASPTAIDSFPTLGYKNKICFSWHWPKIHQRSCPKNEPAEETDWLKSSFSIFSHSIIFPVFLYSYFKKNLCFILSAAVKVLYFSIPILNFIFVIK